MNVALLSLSAFWLGVLTALSPCPMATNVVAISFVGRGAAPRRALACGLAYTLAQSAVYIALAALLVSGLLSVPGVAVVLAKYLHRLLGPLLVVVGLVLLDWLTFGGFGTLVSDTNSRRSAGRGLWAGALLGGAFALTFCPVTAALFFGSLLPLALASGSPLLLPLLYGVGTALPVLALALLLAFAARSVGRVFDGVSQVEGYLRRATGVLFVLLGCYFCLRYVYGLAV